MPEFLDKISSYNIFNSLLPGIIFSYLVSIFTSIDIIQDDLVVGIFFYYFVGLIISRLGSILVEPLFKKLKLIKYADYSDYLQAKAKDKDISLLLEHNNMYRTLCAIPITLCIIKAYEYLMSIIPNLQDLSWVIISIFLLCLFSASFIKQTKYLVKRIEKSK